jgi:protein-S-isoprenylcysteine O-methyltransferase Ste14
MRLTEALERHGSLLFRHRALLIAPMIPLIWVALRHPPHWLRALGMEGADVLTGLCLGISVLGLLLRALTVGFVPGGTSGRNTREQRAHALNTLGAYSIVRHPLYVANFLIVLGLVAATLTPWLILTYVLGYALCIERIVAAEEGFLAQTYGEEYAAWCARTPTFLPDPRLWRAPQLHFSLRTVLRREYNGVLGVALAYAVLEIARDVLVSHEPLRAWLIEDWYWAGLLAAALLLFGLLRTLKRHTRWLHVEGR